MKTGPVIQTPQKQKTPPRPRRPYMPEFAPADLASRDMLTTAEAAWVLHIGESLLYKLNLTSDATTGNPALHSVKVWRRRLIPRKAIDPYLEALA